MNPLREHPSTPPGDSLRQLVSDGMDGQPDALDMALARWASDAELRRTWHSYHLAGDAMRSDDLAGVPGHDEVFLQGIRARLASEPIVFAPTPVARAAALGSRRWAVAAAAAGFMMVGGAMVVLRNPPERESGSAALSPSGAGGGATASLVLGGPVSAGIASLRPVSVAAVGTGAASAGTSAPGAQRPAAAPLGDPQFRVVDGAVIRDPRLDAYLRAHRGPAVPRPGEVTGRFESVVLEK